MYVKSTSRQDRQIELIFIEKLKMLMLIFFIGTTEAEGTKFEQREKFRVRDVTSDYIG